MRKDLFSGLKLIPRLALMLVLTLTAFAQANAQNLGQVEFGKDYQLSGYVVSGYFVAPATGTVYQKGGAVGVYTDENHENEVSRTHKGVYTNGGEYTFDVEGGATYYLYTNFNLTSSYLNLTMVGDAALEMIYSSISEGATFDFMNYSYITYRFNEAVEYTSVKITCNGLTVSPTVSNSDGTLRVYVDGVKDLAEKGSIPVGSVATVVIEGLKGVSSGNYYQDKETFEFTFVVPAVGVEAISEVWPSVFKSYWPAGSEEGMIKLTFGKELSPTGAEAQLVYGNTEGTLGEDLYVETLTPVVNGTEITVDLTGKRRANDDMITGGPYTSMIVKVYNIKDIDGYAVASPGAGTVGSYSTTLTYEEIARTNISYETVPENGSSLNGVTELEFWLSGLNSITFDGFKIAYTNANDEDKEVLVPLTSATKSDVAADGNSATFKFEIPEEARNQKNYSISLYNLEAIDGYDHEYDVTAQFDQFVLTYVNPANGSKMKGLEEGQKITVTTNMASEYPEMYMVYEVEDMNPTNSDEAIVKTQAWLTRQNNGDYVAEIPMYVKMITGHTYKCTFTAWATEDDKNYKKDPIGTASVEWYGATEPFKFSDVQFVSIAPVANSEITTADNKFVLTFDGMVNMPASENFINLGMGSTLQFESLTATGSYVDNSTGTDYCDVWTAVVPESFMATLDDYLSLSFKAYDLDLAVVEGNTGSEDQSYFAFSYKVSKASTEVSTDSWEITPAPGKVTELSTIEIVFTNYEEVGISSGYPTLTINGGESIRLNDAEPDWDQWNKVSLSLGQTYTEAGTYVVSFPEGYFVDEEGDALPAFELTYEIEAQAVKAVDYDLMISEDGSTVSSFTQFYVYADAGIKVAEGTNLKDAYVMSLGREIVANVGSVEADAYGLWLTLDTPVEEAGNYVLIVPEGYFDIAGAPSVEKTEYVTVVGKFTVTADPAPGMVKSLSVIKLTPSSPVMIMSGMPTITNESGVEVEIENVTLNAEEGDFATEVTLTLNEEITALGKYTLTIPSYYFMLEGWSYNQEPFEFEYEVVENLPSVTDAWEITPAPGKVTELSTIEIVFTNYQEVALGSGFPTLTINGGESIRLNDAEPDWDQWNKVSLSLGQTYTEAGTYVVSFPEGYFVDEEYDALPAFELTYVIDATSGITGIVADENGAYVVYNLSGVRVLETQNAADLKQLAKGLYIINGVKVYVK